MNRATDLLRFYDATMTQEEWFADHGKIGAGDSGIGEMDSPADAEGIADLRNALSAILEVLQAAESAVEKVALNDQNLYLMAQLESTLNRLEAVLQ